MTSPETMRPSNEEPDFGDTDYVGSESILLIDGHWNYSSDDDFNAYNPQEAERIREEVGKNQPDTSNKNHTIRKHVARG